VKIVNRESGKSFELDGGREVGWCNRRKGIKIGRVDTYIPVRASKYYSSTGDVLRVFLSASPAYLNHNRLYLRI
jgi:hypothetical protein